MLQQFVVPARVQAVTQFPSKSMTLRGAHSSRFCTDICRDDSPQNRE
jgi:hypothetical protein